MNCSDNKLNNVSCVLIARLINEYAHNLRDFDFLYNFNNAE